MKSLFYTSAICMAAVSGVAVAAESRPNVILILADDLGYADLGCQGSKSVKTPNIDKIAERGVRFTDGYVTAPQSGPSRAAIVTGRYQSRIGMEDNYDIGTVGLSTENKVIAEYLKESGYATAMMGKWGVSRQYDCRPPQRGFDYSFWNSDGNIYYSPTPGGHQTMFHRNNEAVGLNGVYSTDKIGSEAVQFIDENKDRPFFLYLPFITPHVPLQSKYDDFLLYGEEKDEKRRTMLAMMKALDDNVGAIMERLERYGIMDNTLIIFLSDNGGYPGNTSSNAPLTGTKSQVMEGGIRIPFMMQWGERIKAGGVYENPVISVDLLPTILAATGTQMGEDDITDGVNLLPFICGESKKAPHKTLYWRFFTKDGKGRALNNWAIRCGDWKLVENGWASLPVALYNLADDIGEKRNLINEQPQKAAQLRKMWESWNRDNVEGYGHKR